jgi:hypothetical protein
MLTESELDGLEDKLNAFKVSRAENADLLQVSSVPSHPNLLRYSLREATFGQIWPTLQLAHTFLPHWIQEQMTLSTAQS